MDKIGLCFFLKGWYSDAVDIFTKVIDAYEIKDDDTAKELRYNLARSLEEHGDKDKALRCIVKSPSRISATRMFRKEWTD